MESTGTRIDCRDFEGDDFDAARWLDSKVKEQQNLHGSSKRIDDYLASLATSLQFQSQDVHESIEVWFNLNTSMDKCARRMSTNAFAVAGIG